LEATYGVDSTDLWRGVGILIVFMMFFLVGTILAGENVAFGVGGRTTKFYIKEDQERRLLNDTLAEKKKRRHKGISEKAELEIKSKSTLTWQGLTYDVETPTGVKRLLNNIDGYVQPGHLTALMGASGYVLDSSDSAF